MLEMEDMTLEMVEDTERMAPETAALMAFQIAETTLEIAFQMLDQIEEMELSVLEITLETQLIAVDTAFLMLSQTLDK